jgi:hypothetical protein
MKFLSASLTYLILGGLIVAGIVKAAQQGGSLWLLIVAMVLFVGLMGKCCLPVKH